MSMRGWKKADCEKEFLFIDGFRAVVSEWKKAACVFRDDPSGSPLLFQTFGTIQTAREIRPPRGRIDFSRSFVGCSAWLDVCMLLMDAKRGRVHAKRHECNADGGSAAPPGDVKTNAASPPN
jgi:hypothetical protein